jgi:hypothetical protein
VWGLLEGGQGAHPRVCLIPADGMPCCLSTTSAITSCKCALLLKPAPPPHSPSEPPPSLLPCLCLPAGGLILQPAIRQGRLLQQVLQAPIWCQVGNMQQPGWVAAAAGTQYLLPLCLIVLGVSITGHIDLTDPRSTAGSVWIICQSYSVVPSASLPRFHDRCAAGVGCCAQPQPLSTDHCFCSVMGCCCAWASRGNPWTPNPCT